MKNRTVILTIGSLLMSMVLSAQNQGKLAKVDQIDGKEIYLLNEPLRSYENVGEIKTGVKVTSLLTRGLRNEHVNDKTSQFTRRAIARMNKMGIDFDGLIYESGKRITAIKFTESASSEKYRLARIQKINGIGVFAMAEPIGTYEVADEVKGGLNVIPFLTHGWVNPSIEKDMKRFVKRADKNLDVEFIAYQTGRSASVLVIN